MGLAFGNPLLWRLFMLPLLLIGTHACRPGCTIGGARLPRRSDRGRCETEGFAHRALRRLNVGRWEPCAAKRGVLTGLLFS